MRSMVVSAEPKTEVDVFYIWTAKTDIQNKFTTVVFSTKDSSIKEDETYECYCVHTREDYIVQGCELFDCKLVSTETV